MKKTVVLLYLCCFLALLLCSCIQADMQVTVYPNGKVDVCLLEASASGGSSSSKEGDTSAAGLLSEEDLALYAENGWVISDYATDSFVGKRIVKEQVSLKSLSRASADIDANAATEIAKGLFIRDGDAYTFRIKDILQELDQTYIAYIVSNGGSVSVSLSLPAAPIAHNATSVSDDGKTLTWDVLHMSDPSLLYATFTYSQKISPVLLVVIAATVVAVAAVFVGTRSSKLFPKISQPVSDAPAAENSKAAETAQPAQIDPIPAENADTTEKTENH